MRLRLLRHATLLVESGGIRLLVDPMLSPAGSQPPVDETPNPRPNPLVELPGTPLDAVAGIGATLVSHLHSDHFDRQALGVLPRDVPVLCQPRDQPMLARAGLPARVVDEPVELAGVRIARTGGRHGTGAIGVEMGDVSGFVIAAEGEPTLYVAGDTIWCDEVAAAIAEHEPVSVDLPQRSNRHRRPAKALVFADKHFPNETRMIDEVGAHRSESQVGQVAVTTIMNPRKCRPMGEKKSLILRTLCWPNSSEKTCR